ncbi:MAG TPA: class I SAM-dependent methyltransferase [Bacteroidetes bacterium]|nr:class I SAM-dependent methyltransferase [Bacteroidota bacterium]
MKTKTSSACPVLEEQDVNYVRSLVEKGGPDSVDYLPFFSVLEHLDEQGFGEIREILRPIMNKETMIGFAYAKPYGYAGDFQIIDYMYQQKVSDNPRYSKWDVWYHEQHAAKAVRNRKEFFKNVLEELDATTDNPKNVLVLGCGPATDVYEFLNAYPDSKLHFDLIDLDQRAIDYAREKNARFLDRLNFIRMNVLRYQTHKFYDLIWSAGLFDYFKEKHFIYLLKKYQAYVKDGGEMIIGNFSDQNPSTKGMHALLEWHLNQRSPHDLVRYALEAGVRKDNVTVDKEPLEVNLFLRVKKPSNPFKNAKTFISWLEINNN